MAARSSADDPMDLGPFLQNYVMKNPFRTQPAAAVTADGRRGAGGDRPSRWTLRPRRRGSAAASNGAVVGSSSTSVSDLLLCTDEANSRGDDVTAWLCDNYRHVSIPTRHRMVAQHLLLRVQQAFPHVTADTVDELVNAAFPGCTKVNGRKNGLSFYPGLVARPDPEAYENPVFVAALNGVTSGQLTTGQAAEKFGVRESALIAAVSWSDVAPTPSADTLSTGSLKSVAALLSSSHKRARLRDSENHSRDEPLCRRYRSSIDDAVEFEMMLQDVSSGGENPKSDRLSARPSSEESCPQPDDRVVIKTEPGCCSAEAEPQPVNFSLSTTSLPRSDAAASVNGTRSGASDDKISPSSSTTSAANCGDSADESSRLRRELDEVVAANLALQEELSARDFHLAQLAEDFFCLHEQFRQLARHFQAVLGDIQPLADQSAVSQTADNHVN